MKRFFYLLAAIAAFAVLFSSCKKDNEEVKNDGKAELLSFGFYAVDNAGVLTEDYVADVSNEMVIRLPEGTDKTALVARFTVGDNDKVYVGTTEQVDSTTANDYTYPVDFIVKDEKANVSVSYTVKVGKILQYKWNQVLAFNDVDASSNILPTKDFAMAISPKDNVPYFFISRTEGDLYEGRVGKLENGDMTLGAKISTDIDGNAIDARNVDIAVSEDGLVYALYYDYAAQKMFVKTGSGDSWTIVGSSSFGGVRCGSYYALGVDPVSKYPVVGYYANAALTGVIARRDLDLCYFDGASWSTENLISDISRKYIYNPKMAVYNGALYLAGTVQGEGGTYFVYKYENNAWTKVVNALPDGVSQPNMVGLGFGVASDGTVYLCAGGDEDANGTWTLNVYKAAAGESTWTRVSTALNLTLTSSAKYTMALNNDLPVVFYKDAETELPMIVSLDAGTKQWGSPVTLGTDKIAIRNVQLKYDSDGNGYAAFIDGSDNATLHVYEYAMEADDLAE